MKIIADENIPFVDALFAPLGEVVLKPGRAISASDVSDADILLVRSVTRVDAALLDRSSVKFVGTCTIGVDHLHSDYLRDRGICYASAPGCNANAVVQYVIAVLAHQDLLRSQKKVVVVGGGNVGSRVYHMLDALGFDCFCVDPFLDADTVAMRLAPLEAIYEADIICMHTPYTTSGAHPTHHLLAKAQLAKLKPQCLLINAGRGGAIDNHALLDLAKGRKDIQLVLDVWEHEPNINTELLHHVSLGSPHIAGYSYEGRVTGSLMIFDALCAFLKRDEQALRAQVCLQAFGEPVQISAATARDAVLTVYRVADDDARLRKAVAGLPTSFDELRKYYPKRREFSHYKCTIAAFDEARILRSLGFSIDE